MFFDSELERKRRVNLRGSRKDEENSKEAFLQKAQKVNPSDLSIIYNIYSGKRKKRFGKEATEECRFDSSTMETHQG
jgi:hypothetical protein